MTRHNPIQTSFNSGEFSPRMFGRVDLEKYKGAARTIENFQIIPEGGLVRRSGTRFVAEVKDSTKRSRLVPFNVSDQSAYVLEFYERGIRVFTEEGQLLQQALEFTSEFDRNQIFSHFHYVGHGYHDGDGPVQLTADLNVLPGDITASHEFGALRGNFDYYIRLQPSVTFTADDVDTTANRITVAHPEAATLLNNSPGGGTSFTAEDQFVWGPYTLTGTLGGASGAYATLPSPLDGGTEYYICVDVDTGQSGGSTTFGISTSPTFGTGGDSIASAGSGSFTLTPTPAYLRDNFSLGPLTGQFNHLSNDVNWINDGVITLTPQSPQPIEITTPYLESELEGLAFAQSADVLYIVHPNHPPHTLSRYSAHGFSLEKLAFFDGPYLDENADPAINIYPSAVSGSNITLTSNPAIFTGSDVGRQIRIFNGDPDGGGTPVPFQWGVAEITAVNPFEFTNAAIASVNFTPVPASETLTGTHNMDTGELVRLTTTDTLPTGLSAGTDYYCRAVDASTLKLYESKSDALADTDVVPFSGTGTGTHTCTTSVIDVALHGIASVNGPYQAVNVGGSLPDGIQPNTDYYIQKVDTNSLTLSTALNGAVNPIDRAAGAGVHQLHGARNAGAGVVNVFPVASAKVLQPFAVAGASFTTAAWRLSAFGSSSSLGFPRAVTFHEQRLWFAANPGGPQRIYASKTGNYTNFGPTGTPNDVNPLDNTVNDTNAITFEIGSNQVNVIQWLVTTRALVMGTSSSNWTASAALITESIKPTNLQVRRSSATGSSSIQPVIVDDRVVSVSSTGLKVFTLGYSFESDNFVTEDLTLLSEHVTRSGITRLEYAPEPHSVIYGVRNDGKIVVLTVLRDQKIAGWARFSMGGTDAEAESVAIIAAPDGDPSSVGRTNRAHDQPWLIVKRTVGGVTKRHIEFIEDVFEDDEPINDGYFLDNGVTQNLTVATAAVTGLSHLAGETVDVLADGKVLLDQTVAADGTLTLPAVANLVHVGYRYSSDFQSLRLDIAAPDGTAQSSLGRIDHIVLRLHASMGGQYGPSSDELTDLDLVPDTHTMDTVAPLFSDDIEVDFDAGWDTYSEVFVRQNQPLPFTLIALLPRLQKGQRGNRAR